MSGRSGWWISTGPGAALLLAAALLFASGGCDTSQVVEPTPNGVVWTRVTDAASVTNPFFPDWRADSIALMYFNSGGQSRQAVMHESGDGVRFLPGGFFVTSDRYPRWVSDSVVVFSCNRTGSSFDIWYRSLATGAVHAFTAFSANEWDPAPRPGQPGLAYTEGSGPIAGRITLIPDTVVANSPYRLYLTPAGLEAGEVDWSPSGDRICFSAEDSLDGSRHIWVATLAPGDTSLTQLTTGPVQDFSPHWSPDGSRIYFTSNRSARSGVWWVSPAGEATALEVVAFEDHGASIITLGVSPDGTRLAVSSDGRGLGRSIWILSNFP